MYYKKLEGEKEKKRTNCLIFLSFFKNEDLGAKPQAQGVKNLLIMVILGLTEASISSWYVIIDRTDAKAVFIGGV